MELSLRIARGIDRVNDAVGRGVAWLALVMVLLGAFNAVARYAGRFVGRDLSSNAYLEGQWYLFSLVFLLGAAWTLREDRHVRVDVIYGRLSERSKALVDLVGGLALLLPFCLFALWVSFPSVRNSVAAWEGSPDPGGLPRWPLKAMILVSFTLLAFQGVAEVIKRVAFLRGHLSGPGDGVKGPRDEAGGTKGGVGGPEDEGGGPESEVGGLEHEEPGGRAGGT